jgi:hypothetical protein
LLILKGLREFFRSIMSGFGPDGSAVPLYPMIAYEMAETGGRKVAIYIDIIDK